MIGNGMMTLQGVPRQHPIPQFLWNQERIKKELFSTYSNASIIRVTLSMMPDLLPREVRLVVLWG
jgi:hypothetical protein